MRQVTYEQIEHALQEWISSGGNVTHGRWGIYIGRDGSVQLASNEAKAVCPIGAYILLHSEGSHDSLDELEIASHVLRWPVLKVRQFIQGFDGNNFIEERHIRAYQAGVRLRKKYMG